MEGSFTECMDEAVLDIKIDMMQAGEGVGMRARYQAILGIMNQIADYAVSNGFESVYVSGTGGSIEGENLLINALQTIMEKCPQVADAFAISDGSPSISLLLCPWTNMNIFLPYTDKFMWSGEQYPTVIWFMPDPSDSDFDLDNSVKDYAKMSPNQQNLAKMYYSQFLDEEKYIALQTYVTNTYCLNVRAFRLFTPIPAWKDRKKTDVKRAILCPDAFDQRNTIIRLPETPGYSLSFAVWGFYNGVARATGVEHIRAARNIQRGEP
jgi:hypothetical protein